MLACQGPLHIGLWAWERSLLDREAALQAYPFYALRSDYGKAYCRRKSQDGIVDVEVVVDDFGTVEYINGRLCVSITHTSDSHT